MRNIIEGITIAFSLIGWRMIPIPPALPGQIGMPPTNDVPGLHIDQENLDQLKTNLSFH